MTVDSFTSPEIFIDATAERAKVVLQGRPSAIQEREAAMFAQSERKRADQKITQDLRDKCRPEVDEYVDCTTGRFLSIVACKDLAMKMRRCLVKYKGAVDIEQRRAELVKEMEDQGEVLDRDLLARRNNLFTGRDK